MVCKRCGSDKVNIQAVTEIKKKRKGLFYWTIGWFIDLMLWIFLTLPRLIVAIFKPKKMVSKTRKMAICQECGNSWRV